MRKTFDPFFVSQHISRRSRSKTYSFCSVDSLCRGMSYLNWMDWPQDNLWFDSLSLALTVDEGPGLEWGS